MPGFKHILVPLDGSKSSELSIQVAQKAASQDGQITLVQIAEDMVADHQLPHDSDKQAFWKSQSEPVYDYLKSLLGSIAREDVRVEVIVASGHPAEAILDIAADLKVDAVTMCSHSRSKLRQFFLGSTVQTVMSRLPVPLIIVHPEEAD